MDWVHIKACFDRTIWKLFLSHLMALLGYPIVSLPVWKFTLFTVHVFSELFTAFDRKLDTYDCFFIGRIKMTFTQFNPNLINILVGK
jgi:hypothetical protein